MAQFVTLFHASRLIEILSEQSRKIYFLTIYVFPEDETET